MKKQKKPTDLKAAHTSNSQKGMGSSYGSGVKNPPGRSIDVDGLRPVSKKALKKPPRSLA